VRGQRRIGFCLGEVVFYKNLNIFKRAEWGVIHLWLEAYLKKKGLPMASPLLQAIINGVTTFLTTGDSGPINIPPLTEVVDIGPAEVTSTTTEVLQIKKKP
jgi:hypothetical protein